MIISWYNVQNVTVCLSYKFFYFVPVSVPQTEKSLQYTIPKCRFGYALGDNILFLFFAIKTLAKATVVVVFFRRSLGLREVVSTSRIITITRGQKNTLVERGPLMLFDCPWAFPA